MDHQRSEDFGEFPFEQTVQRAELAKSIQMKIRKCILFFVV